MYRSDKGDVLYSYYKELLKVYFKSFVGNQEIVDILLSLCVFNYPGHPRTEHFLNN